MRWWAECRSTVGCLHLTTSTYRTGLCDGLLAVEVGRRSLNLCANDIVRPTRIPTRQSLHAAMRRKNLSEELIDAILPNAEHATGPWQQTMAAAAAMELANDGWLSIFSTEEDVNPVDFEVFVLNHTGQSHSYSRADGMTHEQILERRKEQDTRKIVLYLTWPPQFKSFQPEELKVAS